MAASEEFHYVHAPAGVEAARQYTYEIGSYHYNWHRDSEILLVVDGAIVLKIGRASCRERV